MIFFLILIISLVYRIMYMYTQYWRIFQVHHTHWIVSLLNHRWSDTGIFNELIMSEIVEMKLSDIPVTIATMCFMFNSWSRAISRDADIDLQENFPDFFVPAFHDHRTAALLFFIPFVAVMSWIFMNLILAGTMCLWTCSQSGP